MVTAQFNEITEYHIYARLARRTRDAHNSEILQKIGEDERRHYEFWKEHTGRDVKPGRLHLVQTWLWYDGLAQDVPIWSSQGSVIVMLVLILFLEMPRRGLWLVGTVAERLFRSSGRPAERAQKDAGAYG